MKDLLILMESPPYKEIRSIIVYCKFQVRVLTYLRLFFTLYNILFIYFLLYHAWC